MLTTSKKTVLNRINQNTKQDAKKQQHNILKSYITA